MSKCIQKAAAAPLYTSGTDYAQRLEMALTLLARGFALLPLGGKVPAYDLLPVVNGKASWKPLVQRKATAENVSAWFAHNPLINVGIITGKASGGLIVLDFDRNPSKKWLRSHALPPTLRVKTARGRHCYYFTETLLQSSAFEYGEIKAEGGYVVAPLSIHPTGEIYEWEEFFSLPETDIAPLPNWVNEISKRGQRVKQSNKSTKRRSVLGRVQPVATPGVLITKYPLTRDDLRRWTTDKRAALKMARVLGIEISEIGEGFPCVLPGHNDNHPSASLFQLGDGTIAYRDWHRISDHEWMPLAVVRAALAYGEIKRLCKGELAVWQTRLLIEAGLIAPAPVKLASLPERESQIVKKVYDGFCRLLGCKWLRDPNSPTAFAYRFAAAWCGVGLNQAGAAIKRLLALQIIRVIKAPPDTHVNILYAANR